MKLQSFLGLSLLLTGSIGIVRAATNDDVSMAIRKLAQAENYTWKSTMKTSRWNPEPTIGKTEKDGPTLVTRSFQGNSSRSVHLGEKAATETQEGWRSLAELEADTSDNRNRWVARMLGRFRPPAAEVTELFKHTTDLSHSDGVYSGKLSEDQVKAMLTFRGPSGQGPEVRNASGSVQYWIKDGVLVKYQYELKGTMTRSNNEDIDLDRTTTVEISDIGTTEVEIPEAAKEKLS